MKNVVALPLVNQLDFCILASTSGLIIYVFCWAVFFFFFISELLIVGCGRNIHPVTPELRQFVKSIGMKLETVDSVCFLILHYIIL